MTSGAVEHEVDFTVLEDMEFEIECEIASLRIQHPQMPMCQGDPAEWIAWRAKCCDASPRYRLVCTHCKRVYQTWVAMQAYITCAVCNEYTGGFIHFTELKKKS